MGVVYDPVNEGAASGTELMLRGLEARMDPALMENFSISRAIEMIKDDDTYKIFWCHNLPTQICGPLCAEAPTLRNPDLRWKNIDRMVFVSEWQKSVYQNHYKFPPADQSRMKVLKNAIDPIEAHAKPPTDTIKLIYYSVPERGLVLLYDVFEDLAKKYPIELDVFSSYKIYGFENMNNRFAPLLDKVKNHPKINYYGTVSNTEIHEALKQTHIFSYPSVFQETSCIALIEAMSAGCVCVHPSLAGLGETANGHTNMFHYSWPDSRECKAKFHTELERAIVDIMNNGMPDRSAQIAYANETFSWGNRAVEWTNYLNEVIADGR